MSLKIAVIAGSTRPGSHADVVADWYVEKAKAVEGIEFDIIKLTDVDLPFLNEPVPPATQQYQHDHTKAWSKKIDGYDGYVWISAEYNHSVPAALKNAIDYLYNEWARKPVALVSYGSMGGVRAAEHLRQIAAELQMASIRQTVMIMQPWAMLDDNGKLIEDLVHGDPQAQAEDLKWWAKALKNAKK
jgi:NAD(P)H-dependent FMN reductase